MYTNLPYQFYWLYYIATITDFANSYFIQNRNLRNWKMR